MSQISYKLYLAPSFQYKALSKAKDITNIQKTDSVNGFWSLHTFSSERNIGHGYDHHNPYCYSQTKWSVHLKIALMNWLFETWTR